MSNTNIYINHIQRLDASVEIIKRRTRMSLLELASLATAATSVFLGVLFSAFSSTDIVLSYFNNKKNLFNTVFVKRGWGWTMLTIILFYILHLRKRPDHQTVLGRAVVRFVLVTVWWVFFTQWCFGLPIMDKVYLYTGGRCINIPMDRMERYLEKNPAFSLANFESMLESVHFESKLSSAVCRSIGGRMFGGHDPSGHVFLLVHSSLYLLFETSPLIDLNLFVLDFRRLYSYLLSDSPVSGKLRRVSNFVVSNPVIFVWNLTCLWWWMLLMTSIYFHNILEKVIGLLWGFLGIFLIYIFPRYR